MKNLLLISLLFVIIISKAQITLENYYTNASVVSFVRLSPTDNKWAVIDANTIKLYNLNHSLYKTIPIIGAPVEAWNVMYISKSLFDTDSTTIEYMVDPNDFPIGPKIYREDGTLLFSEAGLAVCAFGTTGPNPMRPIDWNAIIETIEGPKMILAHFTSGAQIDGFKVFGLPGVYYPCGISPLNTTENRIELSNSYPNPTNSTTKIDYTLPNGVNKGEIIFYDTQGKEVKRFNVDRTFNSLLISTEDLQSGIYYYNLQTVQGNSGAKKLVTVK